MTFHVTRGLAQSPCVLIRYAFRYAEGHENDKPYARSSSHHSPIFDGLTPRSSSVFTIR